MRPFKVDPLKSLRCMEVCLEHGEEEGRGRWVGLRGQKDVALFTWQGGSNELVIRGEEG